MVEVLHAPPASGIVANSGAMTVKNGEMTKMCSFELEPGTWIVRVRAIWSTSSSGYRELTVNAGEEASGTATLRVAPCAGKATIASYAFAAVAGSATKYGVWSNQNSGADLKSCYAQVYATRIA